MACVSSQGMETLSSLHVSPEKLFTMSNGKHQAPTPPRRGFKQRGSNIAISAVRESAVILQQERVARQEKPRQVVGKFLCARCRVRNERHRTQEHQHFRQLDFVQLDAGRGEARGRRRVGVYHGIHIRPQPLSGAMHVRLRSGTALALQRVAIQITQHQISLPECTHISAVTRAEEAVLGDTSTDVSRERHVVTLRAEVSARFDELSPDGIQINCFCCCHGRGLPPIHPSSWTHGSAME